MTSTLLGVSAEVARDFVGKADEITAAVSARAAEMTRILDEKSSTLLTALTGKSQEFANEVSRVTDHAVKAIEAKGFTFTRTMSLAVTMVPDAPYSLSATRQTSFCFTGS